MTQKENGTDEKKDFYAKATTRGQSVNNEGMGITP